MEFESSAGPSNNGMDLMNNHHKRTCDLVEDAESKKSKLDTSCDETIDTAMSSPPKNPGSPSENSIQDPNLGSNDGRMETMVDPATAAWEEFQQSQANLESVPNLQSYLEAKSNRENAKKHFLTNTEIFFEGLTQTMDDLLQHSVVAIHNEMEERLDGTESDVISTLQSNHNRRHSMRKQMDQANQAWIQQYSQLCNKIVPPDGSTMDDTMVKEMHALPPTSPPTSPGDSRQGENGDPDWEVLGDTPSNQDKIRRFLTAREQFQHSAEVLSHHLDDIHAGLRSQVEAIIQVAVDIHDHDEKCFLALEDDIQFHLVENQKRRANLQEKLEQSAMQAQGLFADLLSRLAQK